MLRFFSEWMLGWPDCGWGATGATPVVWPLGRQPRSTLAMNLLAPFSNRITGKFRHDDVVYDLQPNVAEEDCAIHGDVFSANGR